VVCSAPVKVQFGKEQNEELGRPLTRLTSPFKSIPLGASI